MRVFYGFDNLPEFRHPIVTVGSYDGVHAGHRELLRRIKLMAQVNGGESVVATFSPHPRTILGNRGEPIELLNTLQEKILLLSDLGIDNLVVIPFTEQFSRTSSYDFIRKFLVGKIGVKGLVVGYNHHFGHNKEGNYDYLHSLQSQFGFDIMEVSEQDIENHKVSSTIIRRLIHDGNMSEASRYLCYDYFMIARNSNTGTIVVMEETKLIPREGIYDVALYRTDELPCKENFITKSKLNISHDGIYIENIVSADIPDNGEVIVKFV